MEVVVNRHAKRNVELRIVENKVIATIPRNMSKAKLKECIATNIKWVKERLTTNTNDFAEMFTLKKIMVCGEMVDVNETLQKKPYLMDKKLYLPEKYFKNKEAKKTALKSYVKMLARTFLSQKVSQLGSALGLCPASIEIKSVADGWLQCCSISQKKIVVDYHLIQLSNKLQTYVIVHAFLHFKHEGHDAHFFKSLERYQPDYEKLDKKLKSLEMIKEIF